jgi:putative ABC transport system permease protein
MKWWLQALGARLRLLFARRSAESRMDEELRFHVEMQTEANIRAGVPAAEARRRALVAFGGVERHMEALRDERGARWLEDVATDVRYALRTLGRARGFAAVAVLTLGLGIGAASGIFSIAYGILFRSLPYDEPERLVRILRTGEAERLSTSISPPNFMSVRERSRSFAEVAVYDSEDVTLSGYGDARWLEGAEVSAGFFEVVGSVPIVGRTFVEGENRPGSDGVAVISHRLWRELTAGGGDIVGGTLLLHERPRVVVGVMPAGFDFPYGSDVWIPLVYDETYAAGSAAGRRSHWLNTIARLRADVTVAAAQRELAALSGRLAVQFPESNRGVGMTALPFRDVLVGPVRTTLTLLLAAVGILLLIACANVAGLFLARGTSRQEELAVRSALGAPGGRLVRQLVTESTVVSLIGGALGLLIAAWGTRLFVAAPPEGLPRVEAIRLDAMVVAFCLAVTALTGLATGVLPAVRATRAAAGARLREGRRSTALRSDARGRSVLVAAEIALAVVLLTAAGLVMKSFARMAAADPGFETAGALSFTVRLPDSYDADAERQTYFDELLRRVRALPGVDAAGAVHRLPMAASGFSTRVLAVEGRAPATPGQEISIVYRAVTPGWFDAMRIPTLRGRGIGAEDGATSAPAAVINETAARLLFDGADPVGRTIMVSARDEGPLTIVGVVRDVVDERIGDVQEPEIFLPLAQFSTGSYMSVVVRAGGDPLALVPGVRRAMAEVDAAVPGRDFRTLERVVGDSFARERFLTWLLGLFAAAALLLSAIGVFGLFSFTVAQRTREMAVRTAIGARRAELVRMVLADTLKLAGAGLAAGVVAAVAATRVLEGQLYGVAPLDPATFAAVIALLAATAVLASVLPARRAAAADPMTALRD